MQQASTQDLRKKTLWLAAIAVMLMFGGTFTDSWFSKSSRKKSISIGLQDYKECRRGECRKKSLSEVKKSKLQGYKTKANLVFGSGLVCIAMLGFLAFSASSAEGASLAKQGKNCRGVLSVSLGFATYFVLDLPKGLGDFSFGHSLYLFGGGIISGLMASDTATKIGAGPPGSPEAAATVATGPAPTAAAPPPQIKAAPPAPPCGQCNMACQWIAEYQRWYCHGCKQYI